MSTLRDKTIQGIAWNAVQQFGRQGIRFVISIVLARLLLPEDYGIIGVLMVFIALSRTIIDSGFSQALIQKKGVTHRDESTVFYFNIFLSICCYAAIYMAAPWIESFYKMPGLAALARVQSLALVLGAFCLIHTTRLTKQVNFKPQAVVTLVSVVLGGSLGIVMAYKGFGAWSLVAQQLVSVSFTTVGLWLCCKWRPSLCFSFSSLASMFGFGSRVLVSRLIDTAFRNAYTLVIGKLFTPAALGFYARGESLARLPVHNLAVVVRRVTFPVFSSIQDDVPRLRRGMGHALRMLFFITCPIMLGLLTIADSFVLVVFSERWAESIPYVRILCLGGVLYPLHVINRNGVLSLGRSDLILRLEIIRKVLIVIAIAVTYRWGVTAMVWGQIVQSVLAYLVNGFYTGRLVGYGYAAQLRDVIPYAGCGVIMALIVFGSGMLPIESRITVLVLQVIVGAVSYTGLCWLFKLPAYQEAQSIAVGILKKRRENPAAA